MKKHLTWNNSKKKTISLIIVFSLFICLSAVGILLFGFPISDMYKVEYVKGHNDVLVQKYHKGEKLMFPEEPQKTGYNFIGWSLDKNKNNFLTQEISIEKELTLYAKWQENFYTLSYLDKEIKLSVNSSFEITNNILSIEGANNSLQIEEPQKSGFRFAGWQISDTISDFNLNEFDFSYIQGNQLILKPIFNEITVNFSFNNLCDLYDIQNLSHFSQISINETLTFDICLKENSNQSNLEIFTSNGNVSVNKLNNVYSVKISNINSNFTISINNAKVNKYEISFFSDNETITQIQKHGENILLPSLNKTGYKLIGFKDNQERIYTKEFIITENLSLIAIWEKECYNINLPNGNGQYILNVDNSYITTEKTISKEYNDSVSIEIILSSAYSNSQIVVYAISETGNIYPTKENNLFLFKNINSNFEVVVDNVSLNSYLVSVDGKSYGHFEYGSWILVNKNTITIKHALSNKQTTIKSIFNDENFGGWFINNNVVINCLIQDISNSESEINITGKYSKVVSKITLEANGGTLDKTEYLYLEGSELSLPIPTKNGYTFAGWFIKLVEVNTEVDFSLSEKFEKPNCSYMTLYAGWIKN